MKKMSKWEQSIINKFIKQAEAEDDKKFPKQNMANVNDMKKEGLPLLHYEVKYQQIEEIKKLIDLGADINISVPPVNMTPLLWAISYGFYEIAELLINKGADVNKSGGIVKTTPLQWALSTKRTSSPNILPEKRRELVNILITNGADVNAVHSSNGYTPLHIAASHGHKDAVAMLLLAGANVNIKTYNGETPLDLAVKLNQKNKRKGKEVIELIKKAIDGNNK
ncbi:MAG: ankyrin repeat domain-containing protein [Nanoarchaeota archaeon]